MISAKGNKVVIRMSEINIDPDVVRRVAMDLKKTANDLRAQRRTFDSISDEIEGSWKSRYTGRYIGCLDRTESDIMRAERKLENIADRLLYIADQAENAEAELEKAIRQGQRHRSRWHKFKARRGTQRRRRRRLVNSIYASA